MASPKIVIVGGVAAGASAATRARRMNEAAEIVVFERGEDVSYANCGLPYYVGGQIADRDKLLVVKSEDFASKFNIDVRTRHEVMSIDRQGKRVEVHDHRSGRQSVERYDQLILATGASPVMPPWPGVDSGNVFVLRDVSDTDRLKAYVDTRKPFRAVVIGAGYIGLEMVEVLEHRGLEVSLVELQPHVLPQLDADMAAKVEEILVERQVQLYLGAKVEGLVAADDRVSAVRLADGRELSADLVILAMGVKPNVELARQAGLKIGLTGGIAVNSQSQTDDPDIYAVGDVAEVIHAVTGEAARIPLAGPANRNGRLAGQRAATGSAPTPAAVPGTSIVGFFGKAAGATGLALSAARQRGLECSAVYAIRGDHADYYPGAQRMILKLVFDPHSRRILGAQAVGGAGVDKRIDVIATAMHFQGTIDDLASLDLAYAPQFGSAKDPVHIAAFVAQNQVDGLVQQALPGESLPDGQLIDVRTEAEVANGTLPGAVNIPLHTLRANLWRLDKSKPVYPFCAVGQRGYVAARILMQAGFSPVVNLAGGSTMHKDGWPAA